MGLAGSDTFIATESCSSSCRRADVYWHLSIGLTYIGEKTEVVKKYFTSRAKKIHRLEGPDFTLRRNLDDAYDSWISDVKEEPSTPFLFLECK